MADQLIGDMLRQRREQLGLSIDSMAQKTNIRARVLMAFENSDYSSYPPKGYATGMLSSYARVLGLDPRVILRGYEEELQINSKRSTIASEFEATKSGAGLTGRLKRRQQKDTSASATGSFDPMMTGEIDTAGDIARATSAVKVVERGRAGGAGHRASRSSRSTHSASSVSASTTGRISSMSGTGRISSVSREPYGAGGATGASDPSQTGSFSRRTSRSADVYSTGRLSALNIEGIEPSSTPTEDEGDYAVRGGKKYSPKSRTGKSKYSRKIAPDQSLPSAIKDRIFETLSNRQSRLLLLAVILLVVVLVLAASILLGSAGGKSSGYLDVEGGAEGSAVTTTETDDSGVATATITTSNGNPIVIAIDVAEGNTSLINVSYDDDSAYNGTAVGPWHREFQVTESLTAVFGTPDSVTVTCNGETIDIPVASDGTGTLNLSVQAAGLAAGGVDEAAQEETATE